MNSKNHYYKVGVIPVKTGILDNRYGEIPAFTGMTKGMI